MSSYIKNMKFTNDINKHKNKNPDQSQLF